MFQNILGVVIMICAHYGYVMKERADYLSMHLYNGEQNNCPSYCGLSLGIDRSGQPIAVLRLRLSTKFLIPNQLIILKLELLKTIFGWIICKCLAGNYLSGKMLC